MQVVYRWYFHRTSDVPPGMVTYGGQTLSKAEQDGIVLYSMDGYENKTAGYPYEHEDFDQNAYHETDLKTSRNVSFSRGQLVYAGFG